MYTIRLTVSGTARDVSVQASVYDSLDDGTEALLCDIPEAEIPRSATYSDPLAAALDAICFWAQLQLGRGTSSRDLYLPLDT